MPKPRTGFRLAAEQGKRNGRKHIPGYQNMKMASGVPENKAEAARWYRLAAEQGDVEAQLKFGLYV